jgi:4-hydroxybenzoate polyprenyltransferase
MIANFFRLIRITSWVKNFFVFIPLIFSLHLFELPFLSKVIVAFFLFGLASSTIYVFNDIIDLDADKEHPVKRFRPLPAGKFTIKSAYLIVLILFFSTLILSILLLDFSFTIILLIFFALNSLYTLVFKNIVLLDIFSIATGFAIRVYAGAFVISVPISSWLILATIFVSLFLAVMKRHSELKRFEGNSEIKSRKVLSSYSIDFTNQMATVSASGLVICYALYTVAERTVNIFGTENLIYTTPFVVFGIFRFMYLEYINQKGENTTEIVLTDIPTIVNLFLYLLLSIMIIYKFI